MAAPLRCHLRLHLACPAAWVHACSTRVSPECSFLCDLTHNIFAPLRESHTVLLRGSREAGCYGLWSHREGVAIPVTSLGDAAGRWTD
eukprot:364098-Chlamydomonas_euryale.AAC.5